MAPITAICANKMKKKAVNKSKNEPQTSAKFEVEPSSPSRKFECYFVTSIKEKVITYQACV